MDLIYLKHRDVIESLFCAEDIPLILVDPLKNLFDKDSLKKIKYDENIVALFFEEFNKINSKLKVHYFIEVTSDISEWIVQLLISEDDGAGARRRYQLSNSLIHLYDEFFVDNVVFDSNVIKFSVKNNLISAQTAKTLNTVLLEDGKEFAKHKFLSVIHVRSADCYSKFLFLCWRYCPIYLQIFNPNTYNLLENCLSDEEVQDCIKVVSCSDMEDLMKDIHSEKVVSAISESDPRLQDIPVPMPSFLEVEAKSSLDSYGDDSDYDDDGDDDPLGINFDDLFGRCMNQGAQEMLRYGPESNGPKESTSLEMRRYQEELATKGFEGANVLICAPTSSGKTIVAIKIIEEHLKVNSVRKAAFVVPTTVLVDQQFNLFDKYLGKKFRITKVSGGTKAFTAPLSEQMKDFDIFVFTCDILRNSLEDVNEPLSSIGKFSLIIFDECHHCDKDHSYNKVMDHYFKDKLLDKVVPQIVGMTASTGTDKAKSVDAALKSLISLCANLDCHIVSTVKDNTEELKMSLPSPSSDVKSLGARALDMFESRLLELMMATEDIVSNIFSSKKPIGVPEDKYHDKYLTFVKSLSNHFPALWSEEERKGIKISEIYLENLFRALIVNHLFSSTHAVAMLKERIDLNTPCTCEVEEVLRGRLREFLSCTSLSQDKNPSLECLKDEIVKQMKQDKASKIIIFVKEVLYTKILEKEIETARLGFVQCKALVGTNKGSDQGGLSKSETEDIVAKFRRGIINLIFATSVAEEGLDVEKCNLVIRYGHVTNEIAMVQSRGRARASNSKYILIVPHKLKWQINKENINKIRESMMYKAIEKFQAMDRRQVGMELFKFQDKRLALRSMSSSNNTSPVEVVSRTQECSHWDIHCDKCGHYKCNSRDIRLANGTSYVVINKETYPNLKMKKGSQNNHPMVCRKCETSLGYIIKVEGVNVPTIKINQCSLRQGRETVKKKKWKDVPFTVDVLTAMELRRCINDDYNVDGL